MARAAAKKKHPSKSLEQGPSDAADALRVNQEPSEYKPVVLVAGSRLGGLRAR
jgi:hypothetical protein